MEAWTGMNPRFTVTDKRRLGTPDDSPRCGFVHPEYGRCSLREHDAARHGYAIEGGILFVQKVTFVPMGVSTPKKRARTPGRGSASDESAAPGAGTRPPRSLTRSLKVQGGEAR